MDSGGKVCKQKRSDQDHCHIVSGERADKTILHDAIGKEQRSQRETSNLGAARGSHVSYRVLLHPRAARFLEKTDTSVRVRLKQSLQELKNSPERKGERLKYSQFWRIRVGDYRAIYEIEDEKKTVIVLFIGHRRDVYDEFSRLLD